MQASPPRNLVRVSSIFPPQRKLIPRKEGLKYLKLGEAKIRRHRGKL